MVADKVEVFTKSSKVGSAGLRWVSDGTGTFEIEEVDGVDVGTTIVLHLKSDCREFADDERVKCIFYPDHISISWINSNFSILLSAVLKKYSNFVGHPVYLNKEQVNELQPLWLLDPKTITKEQYDEFYRFVANTYMKPRFTLHYKVRAKKVNEFRSKCDLISNIVFHLSD